MDLAPFFFRDADLAWHLRRIVSLCFGLVMILFAARVDFWTRSKGDYAFWLYLFGLAFFGEPFYCWTCTVNSAGFSVFALIFCLSPQGAVLFHRTFAVFGGMGTPGYIDHLARRTFQDSSLFPFILSRVGFTIIGLLWQRREREITIALQSFLPLPMKDFFEKRG